MTHILRIRLNCKKKKEDIQCCNFIFKKDILSQQLPFATVRLKDGKIDVK